MQMQKKTSCEILPFNRKTSIYMWDYYYSDCFYVSSALHRAYEDIHMGCKKNRAVIGCLIPQGIGKFVFVFRFSLWLLLMGTFKVLVAILLLFSSGLSCDALLATSCISTNTTSLYRLPWVAIPRHYDLYLRPDVINYKYIDGKIISFI